MALFAHANYRSSYHRIEGISYTVCPGEWICSIRQLASWFKIKSQRKALEILEFLQKQHYITYSAFARGKLIRYKVLNWEKNNTSLENNHPCQKNNGFFFFPVAQAHELVSMGRCSEIDIVLDLWIHTVYKEEKVRGSNEGPVVYFRNCTGDPFVSYAALAERWGLSKSTVGRILNKLETLNYLTLIPCTGKKGSIIYLNNYLSTMFEISDVMIDKAEIAMQLQINIRISENEISNIEDIKHEIKDKQICVSDCFSCVPKPHIKATLQKVSQALELSGLCCCGCNESLYILSNYIGCKQKDVCELKIICNHNSINYCFELKIININEKGDKINENEFSTDGLYNILNRKTSAKVPLVQRINETYKKYIEDGKENDSKKIVIVEKEEQIESINFPNINGYCTVFDYGIIQYYKKKGE